MKKIFALILFAFISMSGITQSIYNGGLENWDSIHSSTTSAYWWQPSHEGYNWLGTLDTLAGLPVTAGGPGPITVFRTTDAYSGTYAAKLVSRPFNLGVTIFIPGMLGTAVMDMIGVRAIIGNPCPGCKPLHFKGYYKFEPAGEDSCAVVAIVSKWNSETHKRDTIAYGKMVQHSAVSTYTPFDIALTYGLSGVPDTLSYLMVSSAGFNVIDFKDSHGNDGSTMYIDEVSLEYPAGIEQSLMPDVGVKVYPNPATEQITVELSDKVENGRLEVYATDGKSIATYKLKEVNTTIPVKGLSAGTYYFKLMERNHLLNTGTFLIVK
jgi:hypothetical protein